MLEQANTAESRVMAYYQVLMQSLAASGQVEAGFTLLQQMRTGWQSQSDKNCYPVFRMLLHACRLVEDFDGASRLQAAVDQLGLKARLSIATALVQGSLNQCTVGKLQAILMTFVMLSSCGLSCARR